MAIDRSLLAIQLDRGDIVGRAVLLPDSSISRLWSGTHLTNYSFTATSETYTSFSSRTMTFSLKDAYAKKSTEWRSLKMSKFSLSNEMIGGRVSDFFPRLCLKAMLCISVSDSTERGVCLFSFHSESDDKTNQNWAHRCANSCTLHSRQATCSGPFLHLSR